MEGFRQALGAIYVALADAAGGDDALRRANSVIVDALDHGAIRDPDARSVLRLLVDATSEVA